MIDQHRVDLASHIVSSYVAFTTEYDLLPSEFIVYHGLIQACHRKDKKMAIVQTVTTADVVSECAISRETARRALNRLEDCGLVERIDGRWIFRAHKNIP